jgi:hypothetical protein
MDTFIPAGTYYQRIDMAGDRADHVVYLRPNGTFLALGWWPMYEYSAAAGRWHQDGADVVLTGDGRTRRDDFSRPGSPRYARRFRCEGGADTLALQASEELDGWSLLSYRGPLDYQGPDTIIGRAGDDSPASLTEVDAWIERMSG